MPPKVFVLGATGFIGGDAVTAVTEAHPDWELTCMVRNSDKGAKVAAKFSKIRLVYGDLDSVDLIAEEAAKADIVYTFADCDHLASAEAVVKGLRVKTTPSWLIHTSGTGILTWETKDLGAFGTPLEKVYNDYDGIGELTSLPDHAIHRNVDKVVLAAGNDLIHTAIVCPPTIYGVGRGPDNQDSVQVPGVAREFLKHGEAFSCRGSENIWCMIHVQDLSNLYLLLGEAAASGGNPATWNDEGYYLAEQGTFVWNEVITRVADYEHKLGLIKSAAVRPLEPDEIAKFSPSFLGYCGSNSIGDAIRARKLLGWHPSERSVLDTIEETVDRVAKKMGLVKGHGERVVDEVKF
ncbi:putative nad dependent epimerase dehydratase family protein [Phaeomoniella chlamydospora]|uniref:Putative nad dependent epimerase dehydratase family protein n=1 Tax=Phaeomoniella chlamydospora TaxID=158046 RepID=A0A0G2EJX3_PHACM|nr:putative nad dependent epimerase dehydratase family protein [Phaeomoniella chlamydospora]